MFNLRSRVLLVAAALIAVLAFVPGVFAQEGEVETFGLSEEDFAFWGAANGASTSFSTLDYSFSTIITVDMGEGAPLAAELSGAGVIGENALSLSVTGTIEGLGPVDLELRVVDNAGFIRGIDGTDTWYEISETDLNELQTQFGDALPVDPEALASGDPAALGLSEEAQMEVQMALFGLLGSFPDYIQVTRDADAEGDAVFVAEFLASEFVADPSFETLVAVGIASNDPEVTFEDAQAQAGEVLTVANTLLQDSLLAFTQFIDIESNLVNRGLLEISVGGAEQAGAVDMTLDVTINEYGPDVTVEAPAESTPLSEMMGAAGM